MDKSIINKPPSEREIFKETRFRQPGVWERACGLWVDRIGAASAQGRTEKFRTLGQYAAVGVESGDGFLLTQHHGEWRVNAGDVMLLTPDEPALYYPKTEWMTRWIVWNGPEAHDVEKLGLLAPDAPLIRGTEAVVRRSFFSLVRIMDGEDRLSALDRKVITLRMAADLARACKETETGDEGHRRKMEWLVEYIQQHLGEALTVQSLAGLSSLSEPQFRRVFHQFTGCAPLAFVTTQRMGRAKALLSRGYSIKRAAVEVGYEDPCYFMRVFRAVTGETAGRFIKGQHPSLP